MTTTAESAQKYARLAGVLLLFTLFGGGFGEMYAPSRIVVPTDAAATAENIRSSDFLFRAGFAAYLVEALCDVTLAWVMYVLLRPVNRDVALLSLCFGLVSTALFGFAELFYFCSSLVLRDAAYLQSFTAGQRNTLALLSLKTYGTGAAVFMAFYGVATLLRAYLIFRSGYLPRFLGVLFAIAGAGFVVRNFLFVLAPRFVSPLLLLPMGVAALTLMVWFLTKGIDAGKWEERAKTASLIAV
jgi:Domain of unknown function (DUF4386)